MIRKSSIYVMAILLAVLPLLGSLSKEVAAASSRVAVIKELKGTVKVKKAGGSKEFTAFAKMSLNEGDVLAVGSGGSSVLQFANGTSEDDKLTVASNTKLTFSKLSSKQGTTTKVSMWSGSAWVDVKSIKNKEDQFTLETPTAVMGVRGTHLLVTVNPETGATRLMVAAGVVRTTATGGGGEAQNVYPTQNALITETGNRGSSAITVASADLETLMKQGNADIVRAIIQGAADITAENEQYVDRYENGEVPKEIGGTNDDLVRFKNNTQNLLGAIANQAVQAGLISQERLNQLIEEANSQTGYKVDLTKSNLQLTEVEKQQQELQRKLEAEASKLAADRKAKEEADRKKNEAMLTVLETARKAKLRADRDAEAAKKKKAKDLYESRLSETEKARYQADEEQRQSEEKASQGSASPSPSPSPPPAPLPSESAGSSPSAPPVLSGNADLSNLTVSAGDAPLALSPAFDSGETAYTVNVINDVASLTIKPTAADSHATVTVNGLIVAVGSASSPIRLSVGSNEIPVIVTAEDGSTRTYAVSVVRAGASTAALQSLKVDGQFVPGFQPGDGAKSYTVVVASTAESATISATAIDPANTTVTGTGLKALTDGDNAFNVTVTTQSGTPVIYTIHIVKVMLTGISMEYKNPGGTWTSMSSVPIEQSYYNLTSLSWSFPYDFANLRVKPIPVPGATVSSVNDIPYEGGYFAASPVVGDNTFVIKTLAADRETELTYKLTLIREPFLTLPRNLASWATTTNLSSDHVAWQNVGFGTFATQSSEKIESFTMSLSFEADSGVDSAKLFRLEATAEGQEIATWSADGTSQTVGGLADGLNQYALRMYSEGSPVGFNVINWVNGPEDKSWTALGDVQLIDEASSTGLLPPSRSGPSSYLARVNSDVSAVRINLSMQNDQRLYLKGSSEPLQPDAFGSYTVNLNEGFNSYEVIARDFSGLFAATYALTIVRGDPGPAFGLFDLYMTGVGVEEYLSPSAPAEYETTVASGTEEVTLFPSITADVHASVYYENDHGELVPATPSAGGYLIPLASSNSRVTISLNNASGQYAYRVTIHKDEGGGGGGSIAPSLEDARVHFVAGYGNVPAVRNGNLFTAIVDPSNLIPGATPQLPLGLQLYPASVDQKVEVYQGGVKIEPTNGEFLFTYYGATVSFDVVVSTLDGQSSESYTMEVRPYAVNNASLNNLMIGYDYLGSASGGREFYYAVDSATTSVDDVTYGIAGNASATVTLDGSAIGVQYDSVSRNYDFTIGNATTKVIQIVVTPEAGNPEVYRIVVVRNNTPHNLVLDGIEVDDGQHVQSSSGYYSPSSRSYFYSLNDGGSIDKSVNSIAVKPIFGNNSEGVHAILAGNDGNAVQPDAEGEYTVDQLHFAWNNLYLETIAPDDKYRQKYNFNVWRSGQFEVWDADGAAPIFATTYAKSYENAVDVTVPYDTTRVKFRTLLNSPNATITAKYVNGSDQIPFSEFNDESLSGELSFAGTDQTVVLWIYQPGSQTMVYTIRLHREPNPESLALMNLTVGAATEQFTLTSLNVTGGAGVRTVTANYAAVLQAGSSSATFNLSLAGAGSGPVFSTLDIPYLLNGLLNTLKNLVGSGANQVTVNGLTAGLHRFKLAYDSATGNHYEIQFNVTVLS